MAPLADDLLIVAFEGWQDLPWIELEIEPGVTRQQLDEAMKGHIIAEGSLMGTYMRRVGQAAGK